MSDKQGVWINEFEARATRCIAKLIVQRASVLIDHVADAIYTCRRRIDEPGLAILLRGVDIVDVRIAEDDDLRVVSRPRMSVLDVIE